MTASKLDVTNPNISPFAVPFAVAQDMPETGQKSIHTAIHFYMEKIYKNNKTLHVDGCDVLCLPSHSGTGLVNIYFMFMKKLR